MKVEFVRWPEDNGDAPPTNAAKAILRPETPEERADLASHCEYIGYHDTSGRKLEVVWSRERVKLNHERNARRKEAAERSQESWLESMRKDRDAEVGRR